MTLERTLGRLRSAAIGLAVVVVGWAIVGCRDRGAPATIAPNTTDPQWVVRHEPRAEIALVFVHGVFGGTLETWRNGQTSFFDLLEADSSIGSKVDMYAFGFTSELFGNGSLAIDEAANTLYARLEAEGVLDYSAVVFVNHSMGGLVTLQMLQQHQAILPRVPEVLLFASPQSGADISRIGQVFSGNEALRNMLPGDGNEFIRLLDSHWKAISPSRRPRVSCAYEKEYTYGIKIVEWASATRFCDDAGMAISANHIDIVKPDRPKHDAILMVQRALRPLLSKKFAATLETPDFEIDGDQPVVTIGDPRGRRVIRIKNGGGELLKYSIDQWPDSLFIAPTAGEYVLERDGVQRFEIALVWGATDEIYKFVLSSSVSASQTVLVRVPNIAAIRAAETKVVDAALSRLSADLADPGKLAALQQLDENSSREFLLEKFHDAVVESEPARSEVGRWVRTSELLQAVGLPELGATALRRADEIDPAIVTNGSVRNLAATIAAQTEEPSLIGVVAASKESEGMNRNVLASVSSLDTVDTMSEALRHMPTFRTYGDALASAVAEAETAKALEAPAAAAGSKSQEEAARAAALARESIAAAARAAEVSPAAEAAAEDEASFSRRAEATMAQGVVDGRWGESVAADELYATHLAENDGIDQIYARRSPSSRVIGRWRIGEILRVVREDSEWIRVLWDRGEGYVPASVVSIRHDPIGGRALVSVVNHLRFGGRCPADERHWTYEAFVSCNQTALGSVSSGFFYGEVREAVSLGLRPIPGRGLMETYGVLFGESMSIFGLTVQLDGRISSFLLLGAFAPHSPISE